MPPAVTVDGLTKRYGDRTALDDVSFGVDEGECVALLGPNGAGKSTLLHILATLRAPTAGMASVAGASVADEPERARRRLGVAFQEPIASKHLTAREVLLHHARLYGVDRSTREDRADRLLAFVGLEDRAHDRVSTFSGGMKRRLDLARVLTTDPEVLLLDEPTAGLDPRGRHEIHERIRSLAGEGTTVILATHDMEEAGRLADRVGILDQGALLAMDRPAELARGLGRRVVRVVLGRDGDREAVKRAVNHVWGLGRTLETGDGLEFLLDTEDPGSVSPGELVDALESAEVAYERVTVRDPDLSDVFLELTGHAIEATEEPTEEAVA